MASPMRAASPLRPRTRAHLLASKENAASGSPLKNASVAQSGSPKARALTPLAALDSASEGRTSGSPKMFLSPQMARASASRRVSPRVAASPRTVPKTRANELRVFEDGAASPMFSSPIPAHALQVLSSLGDTDLDAYDPAALLMPTVVELRAEQQRLVTRLLSPIKAEVDRFKDNLLVDEHGFAHDPSDGPVPAGSVRFSQAMRAWRSFGPTPQGRRWREMLDVDSVRARNPHIAFAVNAHILSDYSGRRDHPSCTPAVYTILQDIPRTYANHVLFMNEDSAARQALFNVLVTYADVDPSVGYCQGMSYVAAALLLHMSEEDTFWSLFTLLQSDKHLRGFYDSDLGELQVKAELFDALLAQHDGELSAHLASNGLIALMYVTQWFMRVFTSLPQWSAAIFAMDCLVTGGGVALVQLAYEIVRLCRQDLLALPSINVLLPYLHDVPTARVNETALRAAMTAPAIGAEAVQRATEAVRADRRVKLEAMTERRRAAKRRLAAQAATLPLAKQASAQATPMGGYFDRLVQTVSTPFRSSARKRPADAAAASASAKRRTTVTAGGPQFAAAMSPAGETGGSPNLREPATFSPASSCSFAAFATPTPLRTRPRAMMPTEEPAISPLASPVKERLELSMLGGAPVDDEEDGLSTITPLEL